MAVTLRSARRSSALFGFLLLVCGPAARPAGAVLIPLDGGGNFHSYVDVTNAWRDDERLDVMVLVEVCNADLKFEREEGGMVARLRLEADLTGLDGAVAQDKRQFRTQALSAEDAASRTLFQIFGLVLEDVPMRSGRLACRLYDLKRTRTGLVNLLAEKSARSECATDWYAEDGPRPQAGLAPADPLFLAQAPLAAWNPDNLQPAAAGSGWLQDYAHPSRRYGLQEDRLQLFVPVWPPAGGTAPGLAPPDLRVQIQGLDMPIVLNDTIAVDERGRLALAAGRSAGLFYELDVNILPEGSYRLSLAPLGGEGRGVLRDFTVVWSLAALGRQRHQVLGEGRTVFTGADLDRFLAATPVQQEAMLEEFWQKLNPEPADPVNAAYLEFQYRLAYVREFLGGFDEYGPHDARGEIFLLLGPPDEIQSERMPMNERDQDDARIKVYQRFAPDREGVWSKGDPIGGTQTKDPYESEGGLPMPYSQRADRLREVRRYSASHNYPFELWKYDGGGNPLFVNRFSRKGMGQRFLFVDRNGSGDYFLESSNVVQGEE